MLCSCDTLYYDIAIIQYTHSLITTIKCVEIQLLTVVSDK